MYFIYHLPGKKIGVTRNLNKRVTVVQGYQPGEYEVLDSSDDINYISNQEIELQKSYGYKVDRQKYKDLYNQKLNKMKINVTEQTTTFPVPKLQLNNWLRDNMDLSWETSHGKFQLNAETINWILLNCKKSMYNEKRSYIYNKAYYEAFLNPENNLTPPVELIDVFNNIRKWAEERGLYEKGDTKTQLIKLYEESGELSQALLKNNKEDIIDAIGDSVVVLTNLAHLVGTDIETCIQFAYDEISSRTGKMINGTFVKDE
jgi:NTP pyrophosphatase (non-canonical NTP hydrolase)|tara:strand:+ start:2059 stop:2835 length:777 start_codon:yes stop_codon:yes gene_type:complete